MQEDNIAIRLKLLISDLGINSSVFADNCGISRATLSQLLTGRNKKISDVLLSQIHKAYPALSILWLLFNEGQMWNNVSETNITNQNESDFNHLKNNDTSNDLVRPTTSNEEINDKFDDYKQNRTQSNDNNLAPIRQVTSDQTNISINPEDNNITSQAHHNSTKDLTMDLVKEIEILRKKIRKVVQITIYYDDSTFETFYPK